MLKPKSLETGLSQDFLNVQLLVHLAVLMIVFMGISLTNALVTALLVLWGKDSSLNPSLIHVAMVLFDSAAFGFCEVMSKLVLHVRGRCSSLKIS